ncbi:Bacterial Ig-like domain (group 2) [compost metagenome]
MYSYPTLVSCVRGDPSIASIEVTPVNVSIELGQTQQFTAMATLLDGNVLDVTTQVRWSSSSSIVAAIDDATGLATGVAGGSVTITAAALDGSAIKSTAQLTVNGPPPLPNFARGCTMGTVTTGGLTFTCPLINHEANAWGINYSETEFENGFYYVKMTWSQASTYCNNLGSGYYLPTKSELKSLHNTFGNMENFAGWPTA